MLNLVFRFRCDLLAALCCALFCCAAAPLAVAQLPPPASEAELLPPVAEPLTSEELPGTIPLDVVEDPIVPSLSEAQLLAMQPAPFGYNLRDNDTSWLMGGRDKFGMFSLENHPILPQDKTSGLVAGVNIHWLSGPVQTDMPPRLFDFQIGWQKRKWVTDSFGYDVAARVGAFSDFEGSAREGVRFPSHAVGYYRWDSQIDFVFGVDYLNRDDIQILPVAGVILTPRDDLRLELVFPHPRVELRVSPQRAIYLAGELGGGTWAIERANNAADVVTYRDLRLLFGISERTEKGGETGIEIGYVFDRDLSYRSGNGDYAPGSTLLIRLTERY
ncbi:hypothetical protein [Anatilimnocola floriformis]|uniref:hypothetical protein n=1 Tax=Anatilimnocola floriformis TaxID=2948575 RepID=UPI0020C2E98C|nr:hypothetical protein [Anatilimnocola floriformis]